MRKLILSFSITAIFSVFVIYNLVPKPPVTKIYNKQVQYSEVQVPEKFQESNLQSLQKLNKPSYVYINNLDFTPQAPFAQWDDIRQQEGCEEASILMAAYWFLNQDLNPTKALEEILAMVEFQKENFGFFIHSDVTIAQEILASYFQIPDSQILYNVDIQSIKDALANDQVVIAPMNGKKLQNPNFLNGGPEYHMILIIGYDDEKQIFITHDPGTRRGENYEYSYQTITESLDNYPNSNQERTPNRPKTAILTLGKRI